MGPRHVYTTVGGALEVLQERSRDVLLPISFNVIARSSSATPLTAGGSKSQRIVTPLERLQDRPARTRRSASRIGPWAVLNEARRV